MENIVNLCACWDEDELFAHREEIVALSNACTRRHDHCCRFLNAAASLMGDTCRIAMDCVNTTKLSGYCSRLADRELKPSKHPGGREYIRLISAVTNTGVVCFADSAKALCDRIYLINDDYGVVSRLLLHSMRSKALASGYDVITSYCPLGPFDKIEHLIIPALRIGFMTSNRMHDFNLLVDPYRIINCKRFLDNDKLKLSKRRIAFNRRAETQMISQAELLLKEIKAIHDELENYYIGATDFSKVDSLTEELLAKFRAIEAEAAKK